ncbi:MAG: hypothetical protein PCFJNLEI_02012 [Verrucomicrobiae bacterium]|nr:hypothetical protein [Verrucomicrobiae bacterium]
MIILHRVICGILLAGCLGQSEGIAQTGTNYRADMVNFVLALANHARVTDSGFGIFPQNAAALGVFAHYVATVDGLGQEDLYFGYNKAGKATPPDVTHELETQLAVFRDAGKLVLTIDYPFTNKKKPRFDAKTVTRINTAYAASQARGFVPYASVLELNALVVNPGHVPHTNVPAITSWSQVQEFAYQLQPAKKQTRENFLAALGQSQFDLIVMDYSFDGSEAEAFTPAEIAALKSQLHGKLLAYLSIGQAEDYRWYWQTGWKNSPPVWLERQDPNWQGNYYVRYWHPEWQAIIRAYLDKIIAQGFDGVYLDLVDSYERYETSAVP